MRTLTTVLILCLASVASGQMIFTDDTFLDTDWTTTVVSFNFSTLAGSTDYVATGGNPGDHRAITTYVGTVVPSRVIVISMRNGAIYDPSTQGEILYLSYGEDHKCAVADGCIGGGQGWYPTIFQDGKFYIHIHGMTMGVLENWTTEQLTGLVASDFGELDVGENSYHNLDLNPDFSISGGPIQFGYARANSLSSTRTGRIDNWEFGVNMDVVPVVDTTWGGLKSLYR